MPILTTITPPNNSIMNKNNSNSAPRDPTKYEVGDYVAFDWGSRVLYGTIAQKPWGQRDNFVIKDKAGREYSVQPWRVFKKTKKCKQK
jgi:hypothetical protein